MRVIFLLAAIPIGFFCRIVSSLFFFFQEEGEKIVFPELFSFVVSRIISVDIESFAWKNALDYLLVSPMIESIVLFIAIMISRINFIMFFILVPAVFGAAFFVHGSGLSGISSGVAFVIFYIIGYVVDGTAGSRQYTYWTLVLMHVGANLPAVV